MTQVQRIEISGFRSLNRIAWEPLIAGIKTGACADESDVAIKRLVEEGVLRPATNPWRMSRFTARPIRGTSIVQTIGEERDES